MYLLILILVMIGTAAADLDTCDIGIQCGNKCVLKRCYCGNGTINAHKTKKGIGQFGHVIDNYYSGQYCCTATPDKCEYIYDSDNKRAWCPDGQPKSKSAPCHGKCYNNYEDHIQIAEDGHYTCPGGEQCVRVQDMCQGVRWCGTRGEEEAAICGPDLKCPFVVNMRNNRSDYSASHIKNTEVVRCVSKLQART